ncbi:MAG TPA: MarR family winged helix-turn-helix transcriptional regulator [Solirubrobacteraceae bacterium]|nr:MarR family winged helix-turn-helix transcriptional regulator [Solirubrobacteraceae bacterium]
MSSRLPNTAARRRPENLGVLLREPFRIASEDLHRRFAERGHPEVRPPHGNVMQYLDDEGTRVSVLAERAQITKQSMAELVAHLERHGYVERTRDPSDRRAKLVRSTARGNELYAIAREFVAETEALWAEKLGKAKIRQLRTLLEELNAAL